MHQLSWPKPGSPGYIAPTHGLTGRFMPLVTPFTDDGHSLSEIRIAKAIRWASENGAEGLLICGETGEFPTLSASERKSVLEIAVRESHGSMPIVVNVTTVSTSTVVDLAQHASRHGARAVVVSPPPYGRYTTEELDGHLRAVANYGRLPVIVVDPQDVLSAELRLRLLEIPHVSAGVPLSDGEAADLALADHISDWDCFASGGLIVSPLLLASGNLAIRMQLAELMLEHGKAKVAKAMLYAKDLDVGEPRGPVMPLNREGRGALSLLLQ